MWVGSGDTNILQLVIRNPYTMPKITPAGMPQTLSRLRWQIAESIWVLWAWTSQYGKYFPFLLPQQPYVLSCIAWMKEMHQITELRSFSFPLTFVFSNSSSWSKQICLLITAFLLISPMQFWTWLGLKKLLCCKAKAWDRPQQLSLLWARRLEKMTYTVLYDSVSLILVFQTTRLTFCKCSTAFLTGSCLAF